MKEDYKMWKEKKQAKIDDLTNKLSLLLKNLQLQDNSMLDNSADLFSQEVRNLS